MDGFSHRRSQLYCESIPVASLAQKYGTPLYVYSKSAMVGAFRSLRQAFRPAAPLICYSVKANGNLSILRALRQAGAGFDIVSGGELYRVLQAGGEPGKIIFAGVGKTRDELTAALRAGIRMFNVESENELACLQQVAAEMGRVARVALRLNPNVDAQTHEKITTARKENKFGIAPDQALRIFARQKSYPNLRIAGIHVHLGSSITSVAPFRSALEKVQRYIAQARQQGARIETLDIGGGYCVSYDGKPVIGPKDYAAAILPLVRKMEIKTLALEPGRFIVANSAVLVSRVTYMKEGWHGRRFAILDAGMNTLIRPALYDAYHQIWPVRCEAAPPVLTGGKSPRGIRLLKTDVVGPICESDDCFCRDRALPALADGEYVAIFGAGAYGMSMSSHYNAHPRPCEVMVEGRRSRVIRRAETYADLCRGE